MRRGNVSTVEGNWEMLDNDLHEEMRIPGDIEEDNGLLCDVEFCENVGKLKWRQYNAVSCCSIDCQRKMWLGNSMPP